MFCQPIPWQQVGDPLGRMIGQTRRKAPRVFKKDACNKGLSRRSVRRPPPFFPGGNFAKARAQLRAARTMEHAPQERHSQERCARADQTHFAQDARRRGRGARARAGSETAGGGAAAPDREHSRPLAVLRQSHLPPQPLLPPKMLAGFHAASQARALPPLPACGER